MPVHFKGKPILAEKFKFPGDSGHLVNGTWEFGPLPTDFKMPYVGWWMSEKYDGVRALWNGHEFISRGGKVYHAPQWFKDEMPQSTGLDGEFFAGHEGFACVSGTVRHKVPIESDWQHVKFMAFDILHGECLNRPYAERYKWLQALIKKGHKTGATHIDLVKQHEITSMKQAYEFYKGVLRDGGEGVVIRDPHATYEQRRSCTLLKWKPVPEQEAKIVGYVEGKGRFKGMLGAFKAQMINDRTKKLEKKYFNLAGQISSDFRARYKFSQGKLVSGPGSTHPVIGDVVTYNYMSMTANGLPRQPVFLRIQHKK